MLKTSLYRLMIDYHRRNQKRRKLGTDEQIEFVEAEPPTDSPSDSLTIVWRQALLDQTWNRLEQLQRETAKPYFTILRARVDNAELTTKQLHKILTDSQSIRIQAEASFRVDLHRARKRFAKLLSEQVSLSLKDPTPDLVEAELIELGLHQFCRP